VAADAELDGEAPRRVRILAARAIPQRLKRKTRGVASNRWPFYEAQRTERVRRTGSTNCCFGNALIKHAFESRATTFLSVMVLPWPSLVPSRVGFDLPFPDPSA